MVVTGVSLTLIFFYRNENGSSAGIWYLSRTNATMHRSQFIIIVIDFCGHRIPELRASSDISPCMSHVYTGWPQKLSTCQELSLARIKNFHLG